MEARLGPRRNPEAEIEARDKNLVFAVQEACEQAMLTLARTAVEKVGSRNLCIAGGVGLNSKANGKIVSQGIVD
jgi:carbamoyltransferase